MTIRYTTRQVASDWKEKCLGEDIYVQGGFAFKSMDYRDDGVPLVRISNVGKGYFDQKDLVYLPEAIFLRLRNFQLRENDVLMGLTGDLGKICKVKKENLPALLNQRVGRFIPRSNHVDLNFIFYKITSTEFQKKLAVFFAGGAQSNISPNQIESIRITIPYKVVEQSKIADILSTCDEAIEKTDAKIEKLKKIKQGLMQDLFRYGIDEQGQMRGEATHRFKDSQLGRIPEEWGIGTLLSFVDPNDTNAIKPGPFGSSVKKEIYVELGYKIYGQEQVISGDAFFGNYFITKKKYQELKQFSVKPGDVLLSLVGTIGNVLVLPQDCLSGIINPRLLKISPDQKKSNNKFVARLLLHSSTNQQLLKLATGGTMPVLNKGIALKIKFIVPTKEEQDRIDSVLFYADQAIEKEEVYKDKLLALKVGLMKDLLSGTVRVMHLLRQTA